MSIIYIPIAVILWLIAIIVFCHCFMHVFGVIDIMRKKYGGSIAIPKERYFLYDAQTKKWVETTKDPTGGKHGK